MPVEQLEQKLTAAIGPTITVAKRVDIPESNRVIDGLNIEKLTQLRSLYGSAFELDPDATIILDPSNRPVYNNDAITKLDETRVANIVNTLIQSPIVQIAEETSLVVS